MNEMFYLCYMAFVNFLLAQLCFDWTDLQALPQCTEVDIEVKGHAGALQKKKQNKGEH